MSKKIYDIIPNEKINKEDNFCCGEKQKKKNPFLLILLLIIISLVAIFFFVPEKTEVKIYPNLEDVSMEALVTIDAVESLVNLEKAIIPGIIFSDVRESSENFFSTGTDSNIKRASGVIRVYNKSTPITLKIFTRFLSTPDDLIYKADKAFTIPGIALDGTPGQIDINVTAEEAGKKYNISSAIFSVPGLLDTKYYSNIWAETISSLGGGEESEVKIVTNNDLLLAQENFEKKYKEEAKQVLIDSIPGNYAYDLEKISTKMNDFYINAKEGAEAEKFSVSGKFESSVLSVRKEDLIKIGEHFINKEVSNLKKIVPGSIFCEIIEQKNVENKIELKLVFKAKTYFLIQDKKIKESLANKDKISSISILESMPEIDKVEINMSPFWRFNVPQKEEKINIELKFND
jgi:hypothetical protein